MSDQPETPVQLAVLAERIAVCSDRIEQGVQAAEENKTLAITLFEKLEKKIDEIQDERAKEKGFFAGLIFAGSALGGLIITGFTFLSKKLF